ncbi:MAG: Na/Pi cotransporter family protein, partial [Gammaproteobacteria bacterium]|nr:Na/Pi cotransporter family protein [Gammaproteobacteria bacterium]
MLNRIFLPSIFLILAYGFWVSPDFKAISAGVAVFMLGMRALEDGFRTFTGGVLERVLQRSTDRQWKSLTLGVVATALMQSSSLVSVITISFLSAGLIALSPALAIVFGANLGTTTGAWLIAGLGLKVDIAAYAMPMLVFGVILVFQKARELRGIGWILTGLGLLFLGIAYMKDGFEAFKAQIDLAAYAIPGLLGLLIYTMIGTAATVVMQSSHATLVLILSALAAGQIDYANALALAIGSNIGTTITALLASLGSNIEGKRLAGGHLLFNGLTGLVAIAAMPWLIDAVDAGSRWLGIADDDLTLKLALFHSLFNVIGVVLLLPWIKQIVRLLLRVLPTREPATVKPLYLTESALGVPEAALSALREETRHLFERAFPILAHGLNLHRETVLSDFDFDTLVAAPPRKGDYDIESEYETDLKTLYGAIVEFTSRMLETATAETTDPVLQLRAATRWLVEAVKAIKHMRGNLVNFGGYRNDDIRMEYNRLRAMLAEILRTAYRGCIDEDPNVTILSLDALRLQSKDAARALEGHLDHLIRHRRITTAMATSLMNDSTYAFNAA